VYFLQAAVDMMRKVLNSISMDGVVVIGEGEKDEVTPLGCCIAAANAMVAPCI
jgi:fructose-1,6-bisphosphatase/sedoheptulose 1,7-bisphosphatase-like protein